MEELVGVVAPEDLVGAGAVFSGDHLPFGAVAADRAAPGGADLLARGNAGHHGLHEGRAIAAPQQLDVALRFNGGVVVEDRAHHRSRGADAVARACSEGEGDGFIGLDLSISVGSHRDDGGGGAGSKGDRLGGWCGGDPGVIDANGGGAAHGVIYRQGGADLAAAAEEVAQGCLAVFRHAGFGDREADGGGDNGAGGEAGFADLIAEAHSIEICGARLQVLERRRGHVFRARELRRQGVELGGLRQDGTAPELESADRIGIDGPGQVG